MNKNYRPEIDGLRAISIFLIIGYHAKISVKSYDFFSGGYIGVDIFLVISGYLITSIILRDLRTHEGFSFATFYFRRIKRLIPALVFVLFCSLPLAWFALLPENFLEFSNSIVATLFFFSNFFFYFEGKQYGASETLLLPLQHMWSLSLEEQYYLLFPFFTYFLFRFYQNNLVIILILSGVFSITLAQLEVLFAKSTSFYFLHTRWWELVSGSVIAIYQRRENFTARIYVFRKLTPLLGVTFITVGVIFATPERQHPSLVTLVPVLGTCLLLLNLNREDFFIKVLSNPILVSFGLISYSLYLWHFPLFSFYRIYFGGNDLIYFRIILIIALLALSIVTYCFIEKPFRRGTLSTKWLFGYLITSYILLSIFAVSSIITNGFEFRVPEELRSKMQKTNYYSSIYKNCHLNSDYRNTFCKFGKFKKSIVLVGDSHAGVLLPELKEKANSLGMTFIAMTRNSEELGFKDMSKYASRRYSELLKIENSVIVIDGNYNKPNFEFDFGSQLEEFTSFFEQMRLNKNQIIFIYPNPHIDNPYSTMTNGMRYVRAFKERGISDYKVSQEIYTSSLKNFLEFKSKMSQKYGHIYFLDTSKIFCDQNYCYSIKDGNLLLFDNSHTSSFSASLINEAIINEIRKITKIK